MNLAREHFGTALVWVAILVFAASNSVVGLLYDLGAANPVEGRNAISFCNVLFVGNLCAMAALLAIYRKDWTRASLRRLSRRDWVGLVVLSVLSAALAPAFGFLALEKTEIINVVLIGRIEPLLYLLLAMVFLGETAGRWNIAAAVIAVIGAAVVLFLERMGDFSQVGEGELYAVAAAVVYAIAAAISKYSLKDVPIGVFTVFRTGFGAVVFFIAASYLFGFGHFQDAFSPLLWQWMVVYGAIIVVAGQVLWFSGLKRTNASTVTLASAFNPIAGVIFAVILLGEQPSTPVLIGVAIIAFGIAVGLYGSFRQRRQAQEEVAAERNAVVLEGEVNFKGV